MVQVRNTPRCSPRRARPRTVSIEKAAEIVSIGGGYYELPDGRRVRGKEAALRALAESA